jgi:hypothetical protein
VLTTKFDILKKPECPVCQTETFSFYSDKKVNISKWRPTLYISQVGPCRHVFQVMHVFLRQFGWISLKKQKSASNNKKWTQTEDLKPPWWSPRRDNQNGYMERMIWSSNEEVMTFWKCSSKTGGSGFHGSDPNLSQDFHRIWLGFFDSWKELCPTAYIYVGHGWL